MFVIRLFSGGSMNLTNPVRIKYNIKQLISDILICSVLFNLLPSEILEIRLIQQRICRLHLELQSQ